MTANNGVWDLPEAQARIIMAFQLLQVGGINRQTFTESGLAIRATAGIRPATHAATVRWHASRRLQAQAFGAEWCVEGPTPHWAPFWHHFASTLNRAEIGAALRMPR